MAIHLHPIGNESVVCELRAYDAADAADAYRDRCEYRAVATAIVCPVRRVAMIEAAHGVLNPADITESFDLLRARYQIDRCQWERASGKRVKVRWDSHRSKWVSDQFGAWHE